MNLKDIRVYDPAADGIDFKTYKEKFNRLFADNSKEAYAYHDSIHKKVSDSRIDSENRPEWTLDDELYGEGEHFDRNPNTYRVIFLGGRHYASFGSEEQFDRVLEEIAESENAFPASFGRPVKIPDVKPNPDY
tara:strand:+ start:33 stop:431 length:399 start_codon:yes stop_codon:yes gene_type:complete